MKENLNYLTTALESLDKAHTIYEERELIRDFSKNHYGMALSHFSMGYTYKWFGDKLCSTS